MILPTLESLEGAMDAQCMAILGDSIEYRTAGKPWLPLKAYVDFGDQDIPTDVGRAIAQEIKVQVQKADVPAKPGPRDAVRLGKIPGAEFRPENVGSDESGTHWNFELVRTNV